MATRRLSGLTTSSSVPDNGGDHSGGSGGGYVDDLFSTTVWEGTGASNLPVEDWKVQGAKGVDLDGEGGLVWIKCRSLNAPHRLHDTERGDYSLSSNNSAAELGSGVVTYSSDGYEIITFNEDYNKLGEDYTSWTFRKAPKFFDVVTYTGTSPDTQEVPHNLGSTPGVIICKSRTNGSAEWAVWHKDLNDGTYLRLNVANAAEGGPGNFPVPPTDEVFSVGTATNTNEAGGEYVAYLFAHDDSDESMIKCGSFSSTGGGSMDIDLGWEPQWLLAKTSGSTGGWSMFDSQRGFAGSLGDDTAGLVANDAVAEATYTNWALNSRGFSYKETSGGRDFIYMAIRRPNKPASEFEPEELFAIEQSETDGVMPGFRPGFPVDMSFYRTPTSTNETKIQSRLTQGAFLETQSTNAEASKAQLMFDYMDGWYADQNAALYSWMWRRAPGYFDVVAYSGTGTERGVPHNLGVTPEMLIIKARDLAGKEWFVHHTGLTSWDKVLQLQSTAAEAGGDTGGNLPTATTFPVNTSSNVNGSGYNYIAYLFASVPGISSIGTYTGTGADLDVDCGFTTGARFVLIKRTDAAGDWMYFDTLRGISSSSSPILKLNENGAQVTGGYIKPLASGFTVKYHLTGISGAEYIYMAIA